MSTVYEITNLVKTESISGNYLFTPIGLTPTALPAAVTEVHRNRSSSATVHFDLEIYWSDATLRKIHIDTHFGVPDPVENFDGYEYQSGMFPRETE